MYDSNVVESPNSGKACASFTLSLLPNLAGVFAFVSDSVVLACLVLD